MILNQKTAIVTGASKGLGKAISAGLIAKRAIVYGIGRNLEALEALKQELGGEFYPVQLDISREKDVKEWVDSTFSQTTKPDILINNAGVGSFHKLEETDGDTWRGMLDVNLNGMFYMTSAVAALMKSKPESSHIINIGSILGKVGRTDSSAYCTTKFGVQGFTQALIQELRFYNIKVTCFNPGSIETDFLVSSGVQPHANMLQPEDLAQTIIQILETPDNMQIDELVVRPLNPKAPE